METQDASSARHQGTRGHVLLAPRLQNVSGSMDTAITGSLAAPSTAQPAQHSSITSISSMEATLQEFNRRVAMTLLAPQQIHQVQPRRQSLEPKQMKDQPAIPSDPRQQGDKRGRETDTAAEEEEEEEEGDDRSSHVLMPNLGKARILCRVCSKRGLKTRSRYGCVQCRLGFHVECFAVFHHPERFVTNPSDTVQDALEAINDNSASRPTRRRENHSIMSFEQLTLPSSDIQEI